MWQSMRSIKHFCDDSNRPPPPLFWSFPNEISATNWSRVIFSLAVYRSTCDRFSALLPTLFFFRRPRNENEARQKDRFPCINRSSQSFYTMLQIAFRRKRDAIKKKKSQRLRQKSFSYWPYSNKEAFSLFVALHTLIWLTNAWTCFWIETKRLDWLLAIDSFACSRRMYVQRAETTS